MEKLKEEISSIKDDLTNIKTDIKLIYQTQATLSEAVEKLTELTSNFQALITTQNTHSEDIHDLFTKYNKLQEEMYNKIAQCQSHTIKIKTLCDEIRELKEAIKFRDKALIGLGTGVIVYIIIELIKLI